jgi:excisionase family DNA binding protein
MKLDSEIITVIEAAGICKVTRATIWRWIKSGLLNAGVTAGGHYRISRGDLNKLIESKDMNSQRRTDNNKLRVLVVDDDAAVRKVTGKALTRAGYQVDYASDGFEAGVKTIKFQPLVIVLDLFMPRMDGFEVCQQIKKNKDTSGIKIIAISGYVSEKNKERILSCGADSFFNKPVDFKDLTLKIEELIKTIKT